jgi:hypothetical protein
MAEILGRRFKRWDRSGQTGRPADEQEDLVGAQFIAPSDALGLAGAPSRHPEPVEGPNARPSDNAPNTTVTSFPSRGSDPVQGATLPGGMGGVPPSFYAEAEQRASDAQPHGASDDEDPLTGWGALPDLVIVDGGKGQLSAALDVMRNLGLKDVPLAGLAKQNEELFVQDLAEPIVLPRTSQALYLVQRIRDEAHRFAITYHRQVRAKSGLQSALDSVPGVGPKRKRALLRKFGSLKGVREASVEDIASTVGFTRSLAEKVKQHL